MWSLKLKKIWDSDNSMLFLRDEKHFTATGLMTYWMAVDRTVKFWDTALSTGLMGNKFKVPPTGPKQQIQKKMKPMHGP